MREYLGERVGVPSHEPGCTTQLWRTSCPDCRDGVYFFSCSCGSRVFLDSAGPPWPLHADRCLPYLITLMRGEGHTASHIRQVVESEAKTRGLPIPSDVAKRLQAEVYADTGRETIVEVYPQAAGQLLTGSIVGSNLQVNFFKRLKYQDNPFGRTFLGKLAKDAYVELRIRERPDKKYGICAEIVCYLPLSVFKANALRHGQQVTVFAMPHRMPNGEEVWLVDALNGRPVA